MSLKDVYLLFCNLKTGNPSIILVIGKVLIYDVYVQGIAVLAANLGYKY
jgi:hypothetical protein